MNMKFDPVRDAPANLLHIPARYENLGDTEFHLNKAARLARVLFWALTFEGMNLEDDRDRAALAVLADLVADHSSAADAAYDKEGDEARAKANARP